MYINDKYKLAYIHIPKTGGVSIARDFVQYNRRLRHGTRHHKYVEGSVPDDYLVFTFVRNPYTRAVSLYRQRFIKNHRFQRKNPTVSHFLHRIKSGTLSIPGPLKQVDFLTPRVEIFKYEDFDRNLKVIAERVGMKVPEMKKTHDNNYHGDYNYMSYLCGGDIKLINKMFREDFTLGYEMWTP